MRYRTYARTGWEHLRNRLRHVGPGRLDRLRRRRDAAGAGRERRARLQLLRHGLGVWRRPQRAPARPDAARASRQAAVRGDESPAEEPALDSARRLPLDDVFPPDHIREYTEESLENLGVDTIDVQQLHAWSDDWAADERWQRVDGRSHARGQGPELGHQRQPLGDRRTSSQALETGLIDWVQVVYNIFDQNPEDVLFPYCQAARHRASSRACLSTKAA